MITKEDFSKGIVGVEEFTAMTNISKTGKEDIGMSFESIITTGKRPKAVCIVSGGLDSTTMLYEVLSRGFDVTVISYHYGQKHTIEVEYAMKTCIKLDVKLIRLIVPTLPGSALTDSDKEIPKDDYSVETQKLTVVPNRNAVFLHIAASYAIALGANFVFYAAHHNDEAVYPDCRPSFVAATNGALREGNYEKVVVRAPFITWTKAEIVKRGAQLGVPFEDTWSCYDPKMKIEEGGTNRAVWTAYHCGTCGTCRERKRAFEIAEVEDPTRYYE